MFGHDDQQTTASSITQDAALDELAQPATDSSPQPSETVAPNVPSVSSSSHQDWQHPGTPLDDTPADSGGSTDSPAPNSSDDLIDIKRRVLDELSPLVGRLDQPPEERFRTLMMMIQASDDQSLINQAYEAAHSITDEKARAQALLDIVNEINYFTQPKKA